MSYKDLLTMYGSIQESAEQRVYIYTQAPEKLKTTKDVAYRDADAAAKIKQLEKLIEDLKDYRIALAARYGELCTMPHKLKLTLTREPHRKGHIEYIVEIEKTLQDGTKTSELREVFRGSERHNAKKRYEELKKQYPGIETATDTAKRRWE